MRNMPSKQEQVVNTVTNEAFEQIGFAYIMGIDGIVILMIIMTFMENLMYLSMWATATIILMWLLIESKVIESTYKRIIAGIGQRGANTSWMKSLRARYTVASILVSTSVGIQGTLFVSIGRTGWKGEFIEIEFIALLIVAIATMILVRALKGK